MAKAFGIKDAVSGKVVLGEDGEPLQGDYDYIRRVVESIRHYEGTDYFIIETKF